VCFCVSVVVFARSAADSDSVARRLRLALGAAVVRPGDPLLVALGELAGFVCVLHTRDPETGREKPHPVPGGVLGCAAFPYRFTVVRIFSRVALLPPTLVCRGSPINLGSVELVDRPAVAADPRPCVEAVDSAGVAVGAAQSPRPESNRLCPPGFGHGSRAAFGLPVGA